MRSSLFSYFIENRICRIIAVYIDIGCFTWMELRIEHVVIDCSRTNDTGEAKNGQYAEKYIPSFFIHMECLMIDYKMVTKLRKF